MATRLKRTRTQRTRVRRPAGSADDLIEQIQKLLNWSSEDPKTDADKIIKAVDDFRSSHPSPRKTARSSPKDEVAMLKEETKRVAKPEAEIPNLQELIDRVVDNPEAWLSTPNHQFGGRQPRELIGTREETKLVNLLRAVDQGLF